MYITRIKLFNWLAYKDEHILNLQPLPIAVVAVYEDNQDRSNWAGKTAFLESIEWCLFGTHRKRYEDEIIYNGRVEVAVELEFDTGFKVSRKKKKGKSSKLIVGIPIFSQSEDGIHTQYHENQSAVSMIKKTLGFDIDDFRATVYFSQGDIESIVSRTSGERRKIISQWLEIDVWQRVQARARAHYKECLSMKDELDKRIERSYEVLKGIEIEEYESVKNRLVNAKKSQFRIEQALDKVLIHKGMIANKKRYDDYVEVLKTLREELKGVEGTGYEDSQLKLNSIRDELYSARLELSNIENVIAGKFDGTCPVTQRSCPVSELITNKREEYAVEYNVALDKLNKIQARSDAQEKVVSDLRKKEDELIRTRENYNFTLREIKRLKAELDKSEIDESIQSIDIKDLEYKRTMIHQLVVDLEVDLGRIEHKQKELEEIDSLIKEDKKKLVEIEQLIKISYLVVKASGVTGVPSLITESILSILEDRTNSILSDSDLTLTFSLDRETRIISPVCYECGYLYKGQKDKVCPACRTERVNKKSDELEILVGDGSGVVEDVKSKSGGAKILVASAIRLAAGLMLKEFRSSQCSFAVIDEPFGALDSENRSALTKVFSSMLGAVGLEQAFIVSHDTELLDSLPGKILITRHSSHSSIEVIK